MVIVQAKRGITRRVVSPALAMTAANAISKAEAHPSDIPDNTSDGAPQPADTRETSLVVTATNKGAALRTFLSTLQKEGQIKLIAEPRLITVSGRPASFLSGGEQAIPVIDAQGKVGVAFEEFGIRVSAQPTLLAGGKIHLKVEPEVSQPNPASSTTIHGTVVPGRIANRINTTIDLEPGQTFVIGGLTQKQVTATAEKVPLLGDLPVVGPLFTTRTYHPEESELIFLVTPSLVRPAPCGHATEACSQELTASAAEPQGSACQKDTERLRRLERRLQRLREEVDDLQHEIRSLHPITPKPVEKP